MTPYVTANGQTGVGVYLSTAAGTFGPVTVYPGHAAAASKASATVSIHDVDDDGDPDIVALGQEGNSVQPATLFTLLGNGDGAFTAGRAGPAARRAIRARRLRRRRRPRRADRCGRIVLHGNGDGSFAAPVQRLTSFQPLRYLAAGDFNGDGDLDVAATTGANVAARFVSIFLGNGAGTFMAGASYAAIRGAERIGVTEVNGDGNADIVVGIVQRGAITPDINTLTMIQFMLGGGNGRFTAARAVPAAGVSGRVSGAFVAGKGPPFALADFNGDTFPIS